jgi:hypothetical protein
MVLTLQRLNLLRLLSQYRYTKYLCLFLVQLESDRLSFCIPTFFALRINRMNNHCFSTLYTYTLTYLNLNYQHL